MCKNGFGEYEIKAAVWVRKPERIRVQGAFWIVVSVEDIRVTKAKIREARRDVLLPIEYPHARYRIRRKNPVRLGSYSTARPLFRYHNPHRALDDWDAIHQVQRSTS